MELFFLIALLAVVVWFNRGMLGFSSGPTWVGADAPDEHGRRKWMCSHCGTVEVTDGQPPAPHNCAG